MSVKYIHTDDVHNLRAPRVVVPLLTTLLKPSSVLDVGCGTGTWLKAFQEHGVSDVVGLDGDYVDVSKLAIDASLFKATDLESTFDLGRRFDIVLCLEVAEHLREVHARSFISCLIKHTDVVVFSAAIPYQGGQHHINEQWLSWWILLFEEFGFSYVDVIRPAIWANKDVDVWYKQNMVVFIRKGHPNEASLLAKSSPYRDLVHPDLYQFNSVQGERAYQLEQGQLGIRLSFQSLWRSIVKIFR